MIKKIFSFVLVVLMAVPMYAQQLSSSEKTILFLIPFYSKDFNEEELYSIKSSDDIQNVKSFQLMGFWAGAQVAFDEYAKAGAPLKIIVKDVTNSESYLRSIMENETLMKDVDLIVGPFFSGQFLIAAQYAQKYGIPIVNPFTTRTDILKNNEYVYKLIPSLETQPATIAYIVDQFPKYQIIMLIDTTQEKKNKVHTTYANYFTEHHISFKTTSSHSGVIGMMDQNRKNIILVFNSNEAKMLMLSRDLLYKAKSEDFMLVVPETWMSSKTYDVEYYSRLNIHYFSDYYVDYDNERTQLFVNRYMEKFNAPPTLENFAFQGYDVARFFTEFLLNDNDIDRVKIEPISFHFSFDKTPGGGYENINTQFLEILDNKVEKVSY